MIFKGINLGSWLLMEGYILGGRNISESLFKKEFKKVYGKEELEKFESSFRKNYIQQQDFKNIAKLGAKVVRVPFNYRLVESKEFYYDEKGVFILDKVFEWAQEYKLKVILDLHAAAGAQNCDWHGDSTGKALLWQEPIFQERTYQLWETLAFRYKDKKALLGYDVLNEAVIDKKDLAVLKKFYKTVVKTIKAIDKKNIVFIEGNTWAQDIEFLSDILEENVSISIHTYQPIDFTFQFVRGYKYPGIINGEQWNKKKICKYLDRYYKFSKKNKVDIYVGEFGVNFRGNSYGELNYLKDLLSVFDQYGFSSTYWTYKAVAQSTFPDGIYQYNKNPYWIRRQGPIIGWENFYTDWGKKKKEIIESWKTEQFDLNKDLAKVLKEYFRSR